MASEATGILNHAVARPRGRGHLDRAGLTARRGRREEDEPAVVVIRVPRRQRR